MSSSAFRKIVALSVPENFDFDPCEIACGFDTIASLAGRCLGSDKGAENDDLLWSIIKLAERFERDVASLRVAP